MAHALSELDRARLRLVSGTQEEHLWNAQVERYHRLGYKKPFGYGARYFIESGEYQLGWPFHAVAASWSNKRSIERLGTLLALIDQVRDKDTAVAILESLLRFCVQGTQRIEESDLRGLLQQSTNTGDPIMQTFVGRYIEQVVQQGEAAMLPRLIEHRLGPPSDQVRERVTQADPNALLQWSERLLDANSLDEVLH